MTSTASQPAAPAMEAAEPQLQELAAKIKRLGLEIFDGPECPQMVRDAIEWFAAELSVSKLAAPAGESNERAASGQAEQPAQQTDLVAAIMKAGDSDAMTPTPNKQNAMKDIERLMAGLEHRARWWRQDGLTWAPFSKLCGIFSVSGWDCGARRQEAAE